MFTVLLRVSIVQGCSDCASSPETPKFFLAFTVFYKIKLLRNRRIRAPSLRMDEIQVEKWFLHVFDGAISMLKNR